MAFSEVNSLDADVTIAIGKKDKAGKPYPKQAEGYYLGSRSVESKRGESKLHFLQTAKGNLGVWGTTDLNRKLGQAKPGSMVRITSTGTKPTPNGDMYIYKVEVDSENTIEVDASLSAPESTYSDSDETYTASTSNNYSDEEDDPGEEAEIPEVDHRAAAKERAARTQALLARNKKA